MAGQSASTPWERPNSSSSAMMLERQSTTVPNTSNANAFGIIGRCSSRKRSSRLQHHLPEHAAVGEALQCRSPVGERIPDRRRWPQPGLHQLVDTELEPRLRTGLAVDVFAVSDADDT